MSEDRKHISNRPSQFDNNGFFLGGGFWILTFFGRERGGGGGQETSKNISWEKSICKSFLISCSINLSASRILMILNLSQGKTSSNLLVSQ